MFCLLLSLHVFYLLPQSLVEKLMMRQNSRISNTFRKEKPIVSIEKKAAYDAAANPGSNFNGFSAIFFCDFSTNFPRAHKNT